MWWSRARNHVLIYDAFGAYVGCVQRAAGHSVPPTVSEGVETAFMQYNSTFPIKYAMSRRVIASYAPQPK
jgi:hypothetical protein